MTAQFRWQRQCHVHYRSVRKALAHSDSNAHTADVDSLGYLLPLLAVDAIARNHDRHQELESLTSPAIHNIFRGRSPGEHGPKLRRGVDLDRVRGCLLVTAFALDQRIGVCGARKVRLSLSPSGCIFGPRL